MDASPYRRGMYSLTLCVDLDRRSRGLVAAETHMGCRRLPGEKGKGFGRMNNSRAAALLLEHPERDGVGASRTLVGEVQCCAGQGGLCSWNIRPTGKRVFYP